MDARHRMRETLRTAIAPEDLTIDVLLDSMLDALIDQAGDGWLIMNGAIRDVEVADRFGPASWEISAHELPEDQESWSSR